MLESMAKSIGQRTGQMIYNAIWHKLNSREKFTYIKDDKAAQDALILNHLFYDDDESIMQACKEYCKNPPWVKIPK